MNHWCKNALPRQNLSQLAQSPLKLRRPHHQYKYQHKYQHRLFMKSFKQTLEEATFEHNKAHPWNFKDLFKKKDYVYLSRDKLAKSCFVCGKYNHTASTCFYYLQQQRNLKQHAFEKTNKNSKVRSSEAKATHFRNSLSPPRMQLPKPQQSCIICGESDHFAANCEFNPFNQILHQAHPKQKSISMRTSIEKPSFNKVKKDKHTLVVEPSAASKNVGNQAKPKKLKDKPSAATKSAAAQEKPSAATKSTADKPKSSAATKSAADKLKLSVAKYAADKANPSAAKATSAADRAKRTGKPSPQQWKAKIPSSIPPRIIIDSVECTHAESDIPRTLFFKDASSWIPPTN
ncbi:hypothetical protein L1987_06616 [Smallanthus sonchifolius]|uniref:Uncharacterized protein n=1 Tax=Smallanthus sonchifolius TaxID=185202 RepID=A0ACB9JYW0_9ASTR|nr:hypothetical protein L1987_06616 [Smallanthus sonchifolius]